MKEDISIKDKGPMTGDAALSPRERRHRKELDEIIDRSWREAIRGFSFSQSLYKNPAK